MHLTSVTAMMKADEAFNQWKSIDPNPGILVDFYGEMLAATRSILSHCWGPAIEEVQYGELQRLATMTVKERQEIRNRRGYHKILDTCRQASEDRLSWVWVDTCCVKKESSSELSEAINSMYQWYASSDRCYAYLYDMDDFALPADCDEKRFPGLNGWPKWFSRGWTLQELVAPSEVNFFNRKWEPIGSKKSLASILSSITRIPRSILEEGFSSNCSSVAQVISWAADRRTARVEDQAYSLSGLLGVHMPMLYGEGRNAFHRLQLEVIRVYNDQSIFAWGWTRTTGGSSTFLADDPNCFRDCSDIVVMDHHRFTRAIREELSNDEHVRISEIRVFTGANAGIQIWLPLKPCRRSSSFFEAKLACRDQSDGYSGPLTITLGLFQSTYFRYVGNFGTPYLAKMLFQQLLLPYQNGSSHGHFSFNLDLRALSHDGFAQQHAFPKDLESRDNSLTLSNTHDFAIVVFRHTTWKTHFALALCYCYGHHLARVICNEDQPVKHIQMDTLEDALCMAEEWSSPNALYLLHTVPLPQTIQGVRMVCKQLPKPEKGCIVMIEVTQCFCYSPQKKMDSQLIDGLNLPGLMYPCYKQQDPVFTLLVDSMAMCLAAGISTIRVWGK
ncbi:heterokaryon incompatibility protein-domain-containing protein [Pisolithus marmoratus]|nr:heterokaryon incompatibility protein-domain-containing protein [Pisolithus marmoratus]